MLPFCRLFSFVLSFLFLSLASSNSLPDSPSSPPVPPSVYELLPRFGLPSGLLPDSVTSFSISSNGSFVVDLVKPCYIQFEYLVYYDRRITGKLEYGGITHLTGIQVKKLLFWFDVDEIKVDLPPSNYIYFEVGWITKKLDVDQFREVRSCGDDISCQTSRKSFLKMPEPIMEITMLITE